VIVPYIAIPGEKDPVKKLLAGAAGLDILLITILATGVPLNG
jgi:translation elongation factor EF-Tu-like GTPase